MTWEWSEWARQAMVLVSIFGIVMVGRGVFVFLVQKWLTMKGYVGEDFRVARRFRSLYFLLFFAFAHLGLSAFDEFPPRTLENLERALHVGTVISAVWFLNQLLNLAQGVFVEVLQKQSDGSVMRRRMLTQIRFVYRLCNSVLFVVGFALCLLTFPRAQQFGASLLASAGVASIVIGLAAQKSIGTLIAGFQIVFTQSVRLDDTISIDGQNGVVEEVTFTHVVVRLGDLRRLVLPITYFIDKPFENWTKNSSDINGYFSFYVDYAMPIAPLREEARRLVESSPLWSKRAFSLFVAEIGVNSAEVRVNVSARNSMELGDLRNWLREQLLAYLSKTYPQYLPRARQETLTTAV